MNIRRGFGDPTLPAGNFKKKIYLSTYLGWGPGGGGFDTTLLIFPTDFRFVTYHHMGEVYIR
jgi:hypothetical protein